MNEQHTFQRGARVDPLPLFSKDRPGGNTFLRFIAATAVGNISRRNAFEVATQLWPDDRELVAVMRAATAPAMTTVPGWAAELVRKIVLDALDALGPASAAAQVMRAGLVMSFSGGVVSAPGFVAGAGNASFVAEGDPIPVRQFASGAAQITPYKVANIAVLTRELMESSNAEAVIQDALIKSAGAALDAVFFDANASTPARPPGLKYGVGASSASTAADLFEAVFEDMATLINAVSPVGGSGPYIFVASPGRIIGMKLRFAIANEPNVSFFASNAIGNDLACIAASALVTAASPAPDVETSGAAALVMDTAPGAIGTVTPTKSMFQSDSIALKVRWPVSWALRAAQGFAWLTPTWK